MGRRKVRRGSVTRAPVVQSDLLSHAPPILPQQRRNANCARIVTVPTATRALSKQSASKSLLGRQTRALTQLSLPTESRAREPDPLFLVTAEVLPSPLM